MKTGQYSLGIDIGGTKANIGFVDPEGRVIAKLRIPTDRSMDPLSLVERICREIPALAKGAGLEPGGLCFAGVGVPGTADIKTGIVEYCPNLGWRDVPLGRYFKELGHEVLVVQDARAAALAELLYGAARGYEDIVCITLGTGIGSGLILNRRIFHGSMNTAGEIGHTVIVKDGRPCSCGNQGCLERYFSGTGILEQALERFPERLGEDNRSSEGVFALAREGDTLALELIRESVEYLALGIANCVSILSPQAVIISGGMCEHEELVIEPLRLLVPRFGFPTWAGKKRLRIEKAALGSDSPMIGAASLQLGI